MGKIMTVRNFKRQDGIVFVNVDKIPSEVQVRMPAKTYFNGWVGVAKSIVAETPKAEPKTDLQALLKRVDAVMGNYAKPKTERRVTVQDREIESNLKFISDGIARERRYCERYNVEVKRNFAMWYANYLWGWE